MTTTDDGESWDCLDDIDTDDITQFDGPAYNSKIEVIKFKKPFLAKRVKIVVEQF